MIEYQSKTRLRPLRMWLCGSCADSAPPFMLGGAKKTCEQCGSFNLAGRYEQVEGGWEPYIPKYGPDYE